MYFTAILQTFILLSFSNALQTDSVVTFIKVNTFDKTASACTAISLSNSVFVTTAHCATVSLSKTALDTSMVAIGSTNPESDIASLGSNVNDLSKLTGAFKPDKIVVHENYDPLTLSDNIALLIVSKPALATSKIYGSVPKNNSMLDAAGVGQLTSGPYVSLVTGNVGVLSESSCTAIYTAFNGSSDRLICAENPKGLCNLDGVLFAVDSANSNNQALIGLGSFIGSPGNPQSASCSDPKSAIFYTIVSFYKDWITQNSNFAASGAIVTSQYTFNNFNTQTSPNNTQPTTSTQSSSKSSASISTFSLFSVLLAVLVIFIN
ncbi:hypothetical protein BB559_002292 [Furculomyces boomerangus]|uniref:Peptidase S1 domain-containing protein n=2 Tax=Harpellales TaxID=61421 RepID=A0A2T9YWE9_9FUNG|nr:hypothetical protein BB559_002292 [Furculomyces boomerangus]PWA02873.1 hypothetical protein BB558_000964 [Smittium angustum]